MSDYETNYTFAINCADIATVQRHIHGPCAFIALDDIRQFLRGIDKHGLNPVQAEMSQAELVAWIREEIIKHINVNLSNYE